MSASLVGSEMCIRDSPGAARSKGPLGAPNIRCGVGKFFRGGRRCSISPRGRSIEGAPRCPEHSLRRW
eukprot:1222357-Alexandrium_andersonii.AAC.1